MGRGDDDAGGRADTHDVPCQQRRRHDVAKDHRPQAPRRAHASGVERKRIALAAGVVADDHSPSCGIGFGLQQVVGDTRGCLSNDEAVHSLRPGAYRRT